MRVSRLLSGIAVGCVALAVADLAVWILSASGGPTSTAFLRFVAYLRIVGIDGSGAINQFGQIFLVLALVALGSGWLARLPWIEAYRDN